jgi:hypothetical protein
MGGQRVWNTQPEGGDAALGMSPSGLMRCHIPIDDLRRLQAKERASA